MTIDNIHVYIETDRYGNPIISTSDINEDIWTRKHKDQMYMFYDLNEAIYLHLSRYHDMVLDMEQIDWLIENELTSYTLNELLESLVGGKML